MHCGKKRTTEPNTTWLGGFKGSWLTIRHLSATVEQVRAEMTAHAYTRLRVRRAGGNRNKLWACLLHQAGGGIRHCILIESALSVNENKVLVGKLHVIRTFLASWDGPRTDYVAFVAKSKSESLKATPRAKERALRLADALRERYPDAHCALVHRNAFELLIATILSAQATDVSVNKVTPTLFRKYPDARAMSKATPEELEPYLRSIGLFRNKAKSISGAARMLVEEFGGEVPRTMEELIRLPGVARKTANVVLGNSFGLNEGFVVDTHIQRLAVRFGLAKEGDDVKTIERKLMALFPRERWCELSHEIIWHGRAVCKARGGSCTDDVICREFGACSKANAKPR